MSRLFSLLVLLLSATFTMAYEQAFEPTAPGEIELKELPAGRLLETTSDESYFAESNQLFRPLFNYIQRNEIAMTTPVEARVDPGAMYFWVSRDQVDKAKASTANVRVIDVPMRLVVAVGARGSYSKDNFLKSKAKLMEWLVDNPKFEKVGEPFAVYWNGPFTPWFMKRYEVQVEVRLSSQESEDLAAR